MRIALIPLTALGLSATPVFAAGPEMTMADPAEPVQAVPAPVMQRGPALVFTLRGGIATAPEYIGSDEYEAVPDLGFKLNSVNLGRLNFGNPDPWAESRGFGLRGSFRAIAERDASEHDDLTGLDDVDAAYELGLGVGYTGELFAAFADVRRGFGGHEAFVAELGADVIARPSQQLAITFGPRLFYGADDYVDTYFGVTPSEASAQNPAYNPDPGLVSAGLALGMRYKINENWGVEGAVTWDKFQNDALDSPIVKNGSEDQWGARIGLTRTFRVGG